MVLSAASYWIFFLSCRASENHTTRVQELGRLCRYPGTLSQDIEEGLTISLTGLADAHTHVGCALAFASSSEHQEAQQIKWAELQLTGIPPADVEAVVAAAVVSKFEKAEDIAAYVAWMSWSMSQRHGDLVKLQELVRKLKKVHI